MKQMGGTGSDETKTVDYHLTVLRMMVNQLPTDISGLLNDQIDKVCQAIVTELSASRETWLNLRESLSKELTEIGTSVKYMQFDLEATRRERDAYKDKCEND